MSHSMWNLEVEWTAVWTQRVNTCKARRSFRFMLCVPTVAALILQGSCWDLPWMFLLEWTSEDRFFTGRGGGVSMESRNESRYVQILRHHLPYLCLHNYYTSVKLMFLYIDIPKMIEKCHCPSPKGKVNVLVWPLTTLAQISNWPQADTETKNWTSSYFGTWILLQWYHHASHTLTPVNVRGNVISVKRN